jgi:hypothetical protein
VLARPFLAALPSLLEQVEALLEQVWLAVWRLLGSGTDPPAGLLGHPERVLFQPVGLAQDRRQLRVGVVDSQQGDAQVGRSGDPGRVGLAVWAVSQNVDSGCRDLPSGPGLGGALLEGVGVALGGVQLVGVGAHGAGDRAERVGGAAQVAGQRRDVGGEGVRGLPDPAGGADLCDPLAAAGQRPGMPGDVAAERVEGGGLPWGRVESQCRELTDGHGPSLLPRPNQTDSCLAGSTREPNRAVHP